MIKTEKLQAVIQHVTNQQLFSETYLKELRREKVPVDDIHACCQTITEWREEYPDLDNDSILQQYIKQCLSTLEIPYQIQDTSFMIYSDQTRVKPVGICLPVNDRDIGRMTKGEHYQANLIKQLRSASLRWGMITNGKHWRLCYTDATALYEVFLEVDLDGLLKYTDVEDFRLFMLFFGQQAFITNQSTDMTAELLGLDQHIRESEKRREAIQRYLRNNVESIVKSLCLGFVQDNAAGTYTDEKLAEIYRNTLYLLYRLLFLFYAEARSLLPVDDPGYQKISLSTILVAALSYRRGRYNADPFSLWRQLADLCEVVDIGDNTLRVNAYNGGLFSNKEKPYLKIHKIADSHLAPALVALGYMPGERDLELIDYSDLLVRHLGTLYEGLLEHRLNLVTLEPVVVRESDRKRIYLPLSKAQPVKRTETVLEVGEVYFADDKGERKSSGSYYTPEDVVQYIVSNTVHPKLQERRTKLEAFLMEMQSERIIAPNIQAQRQIENYTDNTMMDMVNEDILSLCILDPAMGSAHFLVAAGQMMTNFLVETLNLTNWPNDAINTDPLKWKRRVVERCLYGVDVNPLAQELAKLSLWLNSASKDKPLTFLDHHLKIGNSLYGAPLHRLEGLPTAKKEKRKEQQKNLLQFVREKTIQAMLRELGQITRNDSDDITDVKRKEESNKNALNLSQRLRDIAHVWLGTLFGLRNSDSKPIDENAYDRLLEDMITNDDPNAWEIYVASSHILREARNLAEANKERFFHWEIEFPDAAIDGDGRCQFDVIIANPPYVGKSPNQAITMLYETASSGDLYAWLFERALQIRSTTGAAGLVTPLSLTFSKQLTTLRDLLLKSHIALHIAAFDNTPDVLFNESVGGRNRQRTAISILQAKNTSSSIKTTDLLRWPSADRPYLLTHLRYTDTTSFCSRLNFPLIGNDSIALFWSRLRSMHRTFSDLCIEMFSESRRPVPSSIFLTVPRATCYFISATPGSMARNKVLSFSFKDTDDMNLARVLLNSNIFYWYWRAFGDGFCLGTDLVGSFPIPDCVDSEYTELARQLDAIQEQCATFNKFRGQKIPSYNFNKRIDILIDIDKWIIKQVAPDMHIPEDLFAQYKSNSFLRSLDISETLKSEGWMNDNAVQ